jgi:hypothetical protein
MTPELDAARILAGRHAMVSFAHPEQMELVADVCQSFALDNGAFSAWRAGKPIANWSQFYRFVNEWKDHPAFDFALIPDVIDGTERQNDDYISTWPCGTRYGCAIWHLHESLPKLERLCNYWPRVAFGSSGEYAQIGTQRWWERMALAMDVACCGGKPITRLHGLRMLDPEVFSRFPFSSADSTNVARNIGIDCRWQGSYLPVNKAARGVVIADRIEAQQSAPRWSRYATQEDMFADAPFLGEKWTAFNPAASDPQKRRSM